MTALAPSLQAYFTQRLISERAASPNTIASYKLTFQLLLAFTSSAAKKAPSSLDIADLDAPLIASFLEHLEQGRHNSVATRNSRLAAIHSLFGYLALRHPEHAGSIQRVLAVPPKRAERNLVTYLSDAEASASAKTSRTVRTGRSGDSSLPAPLIRHGLRRITPSSAAVVRIALSRPYALATVTALTSASRRRPRRRWPGVSAGLCLAEARPAHAGPHLPSVSQIRAAHM